MWDSPSFFDRCEHGYWIFHSGVCRRGIDIFYGGVREAYCLLLFV